jgi:hypothetical protein
MNQVDESGRPVENTEGKQIQCPHCHSYEVIPVSPKKMLLIGGFVLLALGGLLSIFVIGIPFIFLGLALMVVSLFAKEDGKKTCKSCGFNFISDAAPNAKS